MLERCVVNTLSLQYLFRIHRLQLLKDLFEAVLVAEGVRTELEQGRSLGFQVPDLSQVTGVQVLAAAPGPLPPALECLGQGEAETIRIAKQQGAEWVVLDDWEARRVTRKLGIQVIGAIWYSCYGQRARAYCCCKTFDSQSHRRRILAFGQSAAGYIRIGWRMEGENLEVQSKQVNCRQSAGRPKGKLGVGPIGRWAGTNEFYLGASRFLCGIFAGRRTPR